MAAAHIGIILHDFSTGGSERIAIRLGNAWALSGRRVTLFCGTEEGELRALVSADVTVIYATPETKRSAVSRVLLAWRLRHAIEAAAIDVLFAPGNYHILACAVLGRLRPRLPLVCKLSNPVRAAHVLTAIERLAERVIAWAASPIDVLVAMSTSLCDQAQRAFPGVQIETIAEPVLGDAAPHDNIGHARRIARPPVIVCAGRLAPQKDFSLAIAAFALVDPAIVARLIILGTGPLQSQLEREAAALGIADRVEFLGYVPDIAPYLDGARMLLMTSRFEGYPAVLIEAQAAGLPVVTTNCSPAIGEIVPEAAFGQIVEGRDAAAIARAIEHVWTSPMLDSQSLSAHIARHRIGVSSAHYLALFDRLAARLITQP